MYVCVWLCACGNGPEGEFLDLLSQSQIFFPQGVGKSTVYENPRRMLFPNFLKWIDVNIAKGICYTRWFNAQYQQSNTNSLFAYSVDKNEEKEDIE